jgi:hypothetical protein
VNAACFIYARLSALAAVSSCDGSGQFSRPYARLARRVERLDADFMAALAIQGLSVEEAAATE